MTQHPKIFLREWRTWRALSQTDLMKAAGLTHATISRLENQHHGASPMARRKLAKALGIEPHELLQVPPGMGLAADEKGEVKEEG